MKTFKGINNIKGGASNHCDTVNWSGWTEMLAGDLWFRLLWVVTILALAPDMMASKRNKNRHPEKEEPEDTCVNRFCLDPAYNKLELPETKKTHVRMNLEVNGILKVDFWLKN